MRQSLTADLLLIICVAALLVSKWCGAQQRCYRHELTQGSGSVLICEPVSRSNTRGK